MKGKVRKGLFIIFLCSIFSFGLFVVNTNSLKAKDGKKSSHEIVQKPGKSDEKNSGLLSLISSGLLQVKLNILFWTIVTFGVLVFVLGKWGWKPIVHALDTRMNKIKSDIDFAEKDRAVANEILVKQKELLGKSRGEADDIIAQAKAEAAELKDGIIVTAHEEAQNLSEKAKLEIENAKSRAIDQLKDEMGQISIDIASKIIEKTLDPKDHKELITKALNQYQIQN